MGKGAPNPQPRNGPEHLQAVVIDADADASTELFPGFSMTAGQPRGVASRRTQSRRSFRISIPAPRLGDVALTVGASVLNECYRCGDRCSGGFVCSTEALRCGIGGLERNGRSRILN